jgi:hypothetical protein
MKRGHEGHERYALYDYDDYLASFDSTYEDEDTS